MMDTASHIPTGLAAVTPYLLVAGVSTAIDFYREVFAGE
jgi:hypothetical protein